MSTEEELAKLRIEEEQKKVIEETRRNRKLRQRQLIGEEAEEIVRRKDHVDDAKAAWSVKGTEGLAHDADKIEAATAAKAKNQYEETLKQNAEKGKSEDALAAAAVSGADGTAHDLKAKYDKPKSKMPSLFRKRAEKAEAVPAPKDKSAGKATNYADEFYKIESEEVTMVGDQKHIKVTGISKSGQRVTKTKIILPDVVGETKSQGQQNRPKGEENNNLLPQNFDGQYYSLVEIRQRKVDGIDKQNREQYLSPDEFQTAFKMSKEEFAKLPKWKRDNLKRDLHLYWYVKKVWDLGFKIEIGGSDVRTCCLNSLQVLDNNLALFLELKFGGIE